MRELKFNVKGQKIEKDSACDFSGIVSGTEGYLTIKVTFDSMWNGFGKVAVFSDLINEQAVILKEDVCEIPKEILIGSKFYVRILGLRKGIKLTTNKIAVEQKGL
jgi:hypothetical protein